MITNLSLLYDRQDRSKGIAFVTYSNVADARTAVREFDGANANGQPIRLTILPQKPSRNPFDSVVGGPTRSLFDRIDDGSGAPPARRRHERSASPDRPSRRSDVTKPPPEHIDRYVPGQSNDRRRSPMPRRGDRRGGGGEARRPGARREQSGRRDRDDGGRPGVQGRPRKTAEELDAEMEDYWGGGGKGEGGARPNGGNAGFGGGAAAGAAPVAGLGDDIDMIE